jgi:hypothetical protein
MMGAGYVLGADPLPIIWEFAPEDILGYVGI